MKKNIYHAKSGIYFSWAEDTNSYEPVMHNCFYNEDGELCGDEISKGTIFYDFIAYIRFSSMIIDKKTGKKHLGKFEIYQWIIAFNLIKLAMKLDSSKAMTAISRQAGKTYSARKIIAFLLIFIPYYVYIPEDRYYCILCSPKSGLIEDHMTKMQPDINSAILLFNSLHPDSPIITAEQDRRLKDKLLDKEFDRIINGEQIHYSQIIGLSLQNSVINAGYSAHLLFLDKILSK